MKRNTLLNTSCCASEHAHQRQKATTLLSRRHEQAQLMNTLVSPARDNEGQTAGITKERPQKRAVVEAGDAAGTAIQKNKAFRSLSCLLKKKHDGGCCCIVQARQHAFNFTSRVTLQCCYNTGHTRKKKVHKNAHDKVGIHLSRSETWNLNAPPQGPKPRTETSPYTD